MLRTPAEERNQEKWTLEMELLAQAVEEISIVASNRQRKKPITVPRPDHIKEARKRRRRPQLEETDRPAGANVVDMQGYRNAVSVLSGTRRRVVR